MERVTGLALRRPRAVLAALAAVTVLLAAGLPRLATDVGYRAFLGESHPAIERFDAFLERYGAGLGLAAVWRCGEGAPCESALGPASLRMAHDVARALEASPAVRGVESPATAPVLLPPRHPPYPPRARRFVEADGSIASGRAALAERALQSPLWRGRLVSEDGRTGAILAEVPSLASEDAVAAWRALDGALAPWRAEGFDFAAVGGPVEFVVAGGELDAATAKLIPVMVALVGAILVLLFRSLLPAVAVLVSVGLAVVWTFGAMAWLGWPQSTLTQALAPLVLVIGVCDGIHVVARYAAERARAGPDAAPDALLRRVAADVGGPCAITTATTAAGFLSFASSELVSFGRFGGAAAFGVVAALATSFTLLPILLRSLAPRALPDRVPALWARGVRALGAAGRRRAGAILALALLAGVAGAFGLARLTVDASFEDLYGEESRVVRWVRFVGEHLRKPDTLEVDLALPEGAEPSEPEVLRSVARAGERLAALPELGPARSIVEPLGWMRRLFSGDQPEAQAPAESRRANARLLELLGRSDRRLAERFVAEEGRHLRISLPSEKPPQARLRALLAEARARLDASLPEGLRATLTGPLQVVHALIDAVRATQLWSFAIAGLVVAGLVALFLRSATATALALVPTLLPVLWTLGAMGLVGVRLDVGSAMVAAVVLGLAVDDAVHLLAQYGRRRAAGEAPGPAVEGAVRHVGRALVTTSLALAVGFSALALSPWRSIAAFGGLSAAAILAALAAALLVLPAGVHLLAGRGARGPRV